MEFGHIFKILRENKQLSLTTTSEGIVTKSFLSKFENGQSDISISNFMALLNRLNSSMDDVYAIEGNSNDFSSLLLQAQAAYQSNNVLILATLRDTELKKWEVTNINFHKCNSIMFDGLRANLVDEVISAADSQYIYDYLFEVEFWGVYEIELFGNATYVLSSQNMAYLLNEILHKTTKYSNFDKIKKLVMGTLLNVLLFSLERKQLTLAEIVFTKIDELELDDTQMYFRIVRVYFMGIYLCETGDVKTGYKKSSDAIKIMELIGSTAIATEYKKYLDQQNYL